MSVPPVDPACLYSMPGGQAALEFIGVDQSDQAPESINGKEAMMRSQNPSVEE